MANPIHKYVEEKIKAQVKSGIQGTYKRVASTIIEPDIKPPAEKKK